MPGEEAESFLCEDLGALESLLNRELGLKVSGPRSELTPPMPVQRAIGVGQGHAALGELLQFSAQLWGGNLLPEGLLLLKEALFLLPIEPCPATPSPPRAT